MSLLIIQFIVFVLYVGSITTVYGVLPSISDSWYSLPQRYKPLFTFFTWGIGIPMFFYGSGAMFLSGIGLVFVGTATQFRMTEAYTKYIHFAGAALGIILPLLDLVIVFGVWIPIIIQSIGTLLIVQSKVSNKLWWVEVLAFISIMIGIYLNIDSFNYVGN